MKHDLWHSWLKWKFIIFPLTFRISFSLFVVVCVNKMDIVTRLILFLLFEYFHNISRTCSTLCDNISNNIPNFVCRIPIVIYLFMSIWMTGCLPNKVHVTLIHSIYMLYGIIRNLLLRHWTFKCILLVVYWIMY